VVEPVDPLQPGELDSFERSPWSSPMDDLGLVKVIDRLGQSVVIAVADTPDRWLDSGFGEAFAVLYGDVLRATVTVMDKTAALLWSAIVQSLLQGIEDETGMRRPADSPANDIAGVNVDDERDIDEPAPGRDIGKVRDPQPVGCRCMELTVDVIQRARCSLVTESGTYWLAADDPLQAHIAHQPLDGAAGNVEPFAHHLSPDLADAVNREVLGEHSSYLGLEGNIAPRPRRQAQWILSLRDMLMISGWGDRQNVADRLDPMKLPVIIDKRDHRLNGRPSSACAKYALALRRI
jgi:hypothetical protein